MKDNSSNLPSLRTLDDIEVIGVEEHPIETSVKLYGPPGTGKTTQCEARLYQLLQEEYSLYETTWATYRRSLANDVLRRLVSTGVIEESELNNDHKGRTRFLGTYHSAANRSVTRLKPENFVQEHHKRRFCRQNGLQYSTPEMKPWLDTPGQLLFDVFEWLVNNGCSISDTHAAPSHELLLEKRPHLDIPYLWQEWTRFKEDESVYDYHEILTAALESRHSPPTEVLILDEYHDAYPLLHALAEKWMKEAEIVIVAGDPNQVVNAYQGTDPRFFTELDLPEVLLNRSYRLDEPHWKVATRMLRRAHEVPPVECLNSGSGLAEYRSPDFIYDEYNGQWRIPPSDDVGSPGWFLDHYGEDTLFLARTRRQVDAITAALDATGKDLDEMDVRALTIHGSKGTEAVDVVLYDGITAAIQDGMACNRATRANEFRTWYVGLTRARKRLHIVRGGFDWIESFLPSDIVSEV